jgi:hypothetical protein
MWEPEVVFFPVAMRECLKAAELICELIPLNAPYRDDKDRPPGPHLRDSYSAHVDPDGALITSSVPYWKYVEYGTGRGPAQPHVRPAIEAVRATYG